MGVRESGGSPSFHTTTCRSRADRGADTGRACPRVPPGKTTPWEEWPRARLAGGEAGGGGRGALEGPPSPSPLQQA